ncbi:MAG: hypothetical protein WCR85_00015 [Sphaerochaeta sp.]
MAARKQTRAIKSKAESHGYIGKMRAISSGPEVFKASVNVQDIPEVCMPPSILSLCNALQSKYSGLEFSILLKGGWAKNGFVVECEDYVIPKQTVGGASVDYDTEDMSRLCAEGYNCVLHSHPMNMNVFSGTDENSINVNFDASVLYCKGDITDARVCITAAPGLKLRLKSKVRWQTPAIDIKGTENITVEQHPLVDYYGFGWGRGYQQSLQTEDEELDWDPIEDPVYCWGVKKPSKKTNRNVILRE